MEMNRALAGAGRHTGLAAAAAALALLCAGPAQAALYKFTASGTFVDAFLANSGDFNPTDDGVYLSDGDPVSTPLDFDLTFLVDAATPLSGTPTATGSRYDGAVTNIFTTVDGLPFLSAPVDDVFHFTNGPLGSPSNHQWSFFASATLETANEYLEVRDADTGDLVDELYFAQASLFLLDMDAALFADIPPPLTIPAGNEFEIMTFELVWFSIGPDLYEYNLIGEIDSLQVQAVPLPPAAFLLAPALLPLALLRRRTRQALRA